MNITHLNIKSETQPLSAAQKTFNRLNNRITKLKENMEGVHSKMEMASEFYTEVMLPLKAKYNIAQYELVRRLDYMYETTKLTKKQQETLVELINETVDIFLEALDEEDEQYEEVYQLSDKYTLLQYGDEESDDEESDDDESDIQNITDYIFGKMEELDAETDRDSKDNKWEAIFGKQGDNGYEEEHDGGRRGKRKANKKLTAKQEKDKEETDASLKTLREIYTDLVKKLHPDREKDEEMRIKKTEQMKLVTEAYEKKDLASLLLMQIQWLQSTEKDPMLQSDDILNRYNRVMKMHISKLEVEYHVMTWRPMPFDVGLDMYTIARLDARVLKHRFAMHKQQYLAAISHTDHLFAQLTSPEALKSCIKSYRASQREADFSVFEMLQDNRRY